MNLLFIVLQHAEEAAEPGVFNLNLGVSAWTLIIFLLLMVLLAKFAFPAILGYAEAREQRIQETLDRAAREREEAERLVAEQKRAIAEARQQAQEIIAEGREAGERVREDIITKARAEQEELLTRARREIERERESAIDAIRREAVDLSIAAASKLVGRNLDAEEDRRIVRDFLDRVDPVEVR